MGNLTLPPRGSQIQSHSTGGSSSTLLFIASITRNDNSNRFYTTLVWSKELTTILPQLIGYMQEKDILLETHAVNDSIEEFRDSALRSMIAKP
jgi:hypothetical protein